MTKWTERNRTTTIEIATFFQKIMPGLPSDEDVEEAVQSYEDFARRVLPNYLRDFANSVREELSARRWFAATILALECPAEGYIYLGKRISELPLGEFETRRNTVVANESPLPIFGPIVILRLNATGDDSELTLGPPWEADSEPQYTFIDTIGVPCIAGPGTWLSVNPGTTVEWIRPVAEPLP